MIQAKQELKITAVKPQFVENLKKFCESTTFHGLKFIGDGDLSLIERIFFTIAFTMISTVAIYFISNVYGKWSQTPVIISINPTATYINEIPYPALTICNVNQAMKSRVANISKDTEEFAILQLLCNRGINRTDFSSNSKNNNSKTSVDEFVYKVSQPCKNMLINCNFASVDVDCDKVFTTVITDEGICCTFNSLHDSFLYMNDRANDTRNARLQLDAEPILWTPESGYPKNLPKSYYPRRGPGTGVTMGMSLILDSETHEYYCSSTNGAGFKFVIHNPVEAPQVKETGTNIDVGTESRVRITPYFDTASDTVKGISKRFRQCLFDDEITLYSFNIYTRRNCEAECEADIMATECNCINYYMPAVRKNVPLCERKDQDCVDRVNVLISTRSGLIKNCNDVCLPSCYDLSYEANSFTTFIKRSNFTIKDAIIQGINASYVSASISKIDFFYEENAFRGQVKEEFVGITDFLSSTGGLLGLFLGCSFISVVEVIYFMSLRPLCAHLRYNREYKKVYPKSVDPIQKDTIAQIFSNEPGFDYKKANTNKLNDQLFSGLN